MFREFERNTVRWIALFTLGVGSVIHLGGGTFPTTDPWQLSATPEHTTCHHEQNILDQRSHIIRETMMTSWRVPCACFSWNWSLVYIRISPAKMFILFRGITLFSLGCIRFCCLFQGIFRSSGRDQNLDSNTTLTRPKQIRTRVCDCSGLYIRLWDRILLDSGFWSSLSPGFEVCHHSV